VPQVHLGPWEEGPDLEAWAVWEEELEHQGHLEHPGVLRVEELQVRHDLHNLQEHLRLKLAASSSLPQVHQHHEQDQSNPWEPQLTVRLAYLAQRPCRRLVRQHGQRLELLLTWEAGEFLLTGK